MSTNSCANCNTAGAERHVLKLCSNCKAVAYCDRLCQEADWKAHKSACRKPTVVGDKEARDHATLKDIKNTIAYLEASAERPNTGECLPDDEDDEDYGLGETITIPLDSFVSRKMDPTPELRQGYHELVSFPPEYLETISHLSAAEQHKIKCDLASQIMGMRTAKKTPEELEADRLEAVEAGKIQQRFLARLAAKKAAKEAEGKGQ